MAYELDKEKDKKRKAQVSKMLSTILPAKEGKTPAATVTIDFPLNKENLAGRHYAIRISAKGGISPVELSIDRGDWQGCRETNGFYWFDWHNIPQGLHKLSARVKVSKTKFQKSKIVSCKVS